MMQRGERAFILSVTLMCIATDSTAKPTGDAYNQTLTSLYDRIASDVQSGRPLVVTAHVPLCDNTIIRCGNKKLGDGNNPATNLYWATSGGFKRWFRRTGWRLVSIKTNSSGRILETRVWRKLVYPNAAWRRRGVKSRIRVFVVAHAWRGTEIASAMNQYVQDLYHSAPQQITLKDGHVISAGGASHVVAYVGHNGWMDVQAFDWPSRNKEPTTTAKGTIAVACLTAPYLAQPVSSPTRVPLLMTTSLLFAGAHSFEGAVSALAQGSSLVQIRRSSARNYANGQGKSFRRVHGAFTNPSDKRWSRYTRTQR